MNGRWLTQAGKLHRFEAGAVASMCGRVGVRDAQPPKFKRYTDKRNRSYLSGGPIGVNCDECKRLHYEGWACGGGSTSGTVK